MSAPPRVPAVGWEEAAGLLPAIAAGERAGAVVRGVLPPATCSAVVAALRSSGLPPVVRPPFQGWTWGEVLVVADPGLEDWMRSGRHLRRLLEGLPGRPLDRFRAALEHLAAAPVAPPSRAGEPAPLVTVRVLPPGAGVAVHAERFDWPNMRWLVPELAPDVQVSCYLPLALPPGGGELEVYGPPPRGREPDLEGLPDEEACALLAAHGVSRVAPAVGDLLVFDGGRLNHRVRPAVGGERWTMGCFLARRRDGGGWLAWS